MKYDNLNGIVVVLSTIAALGMAKSDGVRTIGTPKSIVKYSEVDNQLKVGRINLSNYLGSDQFPNGISMFRNLRTLSLYSNRNSTPPLRIPDGWDSLDKLHTIKLNGKFNTEFLEKALTMPTIRKLRLNLLSYSNAGLQAIRHELPNSILKTKKEIIIPFPSNNRSLLKKYIIQVSKQEYILIHSIPKDELVKIGYNRGVINAIIGNQGFPRFIDLVIENNPLGETRIRRY